ncbi:hypothetical protein [Armatimonas rosea]|uniref:Uncharacterized protein n=1 Tax=Armatimonas rosea TaxID=685828 RepID=A0A7W9SPL8_ARMRO|nr:hypothetical protein [Armatimonas rosea]MBB6050517.1 hypothetical protein [Armatimonas rosea]
MTESDLTALESRIETLLERCHAAQWEWKLLTHEGWLVTYEEFTALFCRNAGLCQVSYLMQLAQQGIKHRQWRSFTQFFTLDQDRIQAILDRRAFHAMKALLRLAETQPARELIPVIEQLTVVLKQDHAPLEFIPLHWKMKRALKNLNNLPIPAEAPATSTGLPIPIDSTREKEEPYHGQEI